MTPALRSTRLMLHAYTPMLVTEEHARWLNDKELLQFSEQRHSEHTVKTQLDYVRDGPPNRHLWLIRCNAADIGSITAYVDEHDRRANLGILIGRREYHGQGFAAEAWLTVIDWLFDNGYHKIEAGCREDNWPMRRLATTTGMTLEAEIPGHYKVGDKFLGLTLYGRFKADVYHSEWQQMWQSPFWKPGENASRSS